MPGPGETIGPEGNGGSTGGGGGGGITTITSSTLTVTNPTGPTTDIELTGSTGTVTSVSVPTNGVGIGGTVATPTTTPAITITGAAPLASPALTGTPTAPTAAVATNTTQVATTAFAQALVSAAVPNKPEDFGYFGWTIDPQLVAQSTAVTSGIIALTRFRCVSTGSVGHIAVQVVTGGTGGATATENYIGIYDTGQATPGTATRLAVSASGTCDTDFATPNSYSIALTSPASLTEGQDYFVATLANFAVTAPSFRTSGATAGFANMGLSGINFRSCQFNTGSQTGLPGTLLASNFVSATNANIVAILQT